MSFHILTLDPGKINFGWALVSTEMIHNSTPVVIEGTVLHALTGKFTSLVSIQDQRICDMAGFLSELHALLSYLPSKDPSSYVVFERMTPRPGMGRGGAEIINIMIGAAIHEADIYGVQMFPVTASQWKRWAKDVRYTDHAVDSSKLIPLIRAKPEPKKKKTKVKKKKKKTKVKKKKKKTKVKKKKVQHERDGTTVRGPHAQDALGMALWSYSTDYLP